MSVTARRLGNIGTKGRCLDAIIREQLLLIDERLLRAEKIWGRNCLVHDLPTSFSYPGLEKKDAQRIIYSALVHSLEERGFEVRLLLEPCRSALVVSWVTDLSPTEIEAMNRLIRRVRIAPADLQPFLARDKGGPPGAGRVGASSASGLRRPPITPPPRPP
jgi:hypothetical protein